LDSTTEKTSSSGINDGSEIEGDELLDAEWTEEFMKQAAIHFEQNMMPFFAECKQTS
jgi:hypothetical protein